MPMLGSTPDYSEEPGRATFPEQKETPQSSPSFLDVAAAAERTTNLVGQVYGRISNDTLFPEGSPQEGFNPLDHIPAGYQHDYGARFLHAENPQQIAQIKRQIDAERTDQGVLMRAGGWGTAASLAAGMTDPLTIASMALVPEAAPTRLGNAIRWGLTNAAATGVQELARQGLSETSTAGESVLNIGAGAVLGGVLGSIARRVPAARLAGLTDALGPELRAGEESTVLGHAPSALADVMDREPVVQSAAKQQESPVIKPEGEIPEQASDALPGEPTYVNPEAESTTGAAQVQGQTSEDLTPARGGVTLSKTVGRVAPAARVMQSASLTARKTLAQLANIPGYLAQNFRGIANDNPVERLLWRWDGIASYAQSERYKAFGDYLQRVKDEGGTPLARRDFMDQVSMAMRRGDKSAVPEIARAASRTRELVFQPLYDRALKMGLVPEDAKLYADSYLMRRYDVRKINDNFSQWIDTLREGFIKQGVDPAEATDIAYQATRNIRGNERGTMDWKATDGIVPKSGQMKERTLTLPDDVLEPFLSNDIDDLTHAYVRSMAPEVEITDRFGSRDMKDQFDQIRDEYAHLMEQKRLADDNEGVLALQKQQDADLRDLAAMRDRLYGTFGVPSDPSNFFIRAGRLARSFNALRMLGAATLAHFPDLANAMMRYGMPNTFAAMAKFATNLDAVKLSYAEAKRMGAALDMTMNVTASMLGDYGSHSRFAEQRIASNLSRAFTIATGETPLITAVQSLTSTLAQDEIMRAAEKAASGQALPQMMSARLAAAGLDADKLARIAEESKPHAKDVGGLRFAMSDQWADQRLARDFESAVIREAHSVTLRPGVGDTPLRMSTEWGKLILQFKTFAFAANRVVGLTLAQGLAHGDVRSAAALAALASMGTLSYVAKQKAAGQPIESNPGRLAMEVLDKSNLLGWTNEVISPGLWQGGSKDLSRWSDRDAAETIGGPTAGTLVAAWGRQYPARISNLLSGGAVNPQAPFRRSDLHFLRRMAPGQNLWYMRRGINALEDGVGDLFDLPGKSNADREEALEVTQ